MARKLREGLAIVMGNSAQPRSRDDYYPFHPNPNFLYLAGIAEPECALLMEMRGGRLVRDEILCRGRDPAAELWDGPRLGPAKAKVAGGFSGARPIGQLGDTLEEASAKHATVYCPLGESHLLDQLVLSLAKKRKSLSRSGVQPIGAIRDWAPALDRMRLVKDREEMAQMRRVCGVACEAHIAAMAAARHARRECEVEAALIAHYRSRGHVHAFQPIVAGGANACTLHYTANSARLAKGGLLLVDSGCYGDGYCSDITRTFPVGGRFTPAQREIYALVLAAQKRAIREIFPGNPVDAPGKAAQRCIAAGLKRLGVITRAEDARVFYPHKAGHWLGMDVHDVGPYSDAGGKPLKFAPGMVMTVEPGLYFGKGLPAPDRYRGIGVRIEDDIAVTRTGHTNLTQAAPKEMEEVERICTGG